MHMQIEILCLQLWTEDNGKIEKMHSRSGQSNLLVVRTWEGRAMLFKVHTLLSF